MSDGEDMGKVAGTVVGGLVTLKLVDMFLKDKKKEKKHKAKKKLKKVV